MPWYFFSSSLIPGSKPTLCGDQGLDFDFGADSDDGGGQKGSEMAGVPSSMIVQFTTLDGEDKGPQIDVPVGSTVLQMEELINQLLENKDKVLKSPFDFNAY